SRARIPSHQVRQALVQSKPSEALLQKILGNDGVKTYEWLLKGLTTARAVGVIRDAEGRRIGTGFVVRGGDFIPTLGDERIVVTTAHVISDPASGLAVSHRDATITFEAIDAARRYGFTDILWEHEDLDCTLLRLDAVPDKIEPLTLARDPLPAVP